MSLKTKISEFTQTTSLSGSDIIPIVKVGSPNLNRKISLDTLGDYISTNYDHLRSGSKAGTPEMYGAVGDGVTDDYIPLKHALISHSIVELDAKTYAVRGYIGVPSYRSIVGKGKDRTVIKLMNNSPYGYNITGQLTVIQNTVYTDTIPSSSIGWTGSNNWSPNGNVNSISGNLVVSHQDFDVRDQAVDSPFYQQTQYRPWNGLGYHTYDDVNFESLRKNISIENLTIDCNFDNQARHSSFNVTNNPYSASNGGTAYYVPRYSFKVRPTVHAIQLFGENITIKDVRVKNFGYGVSYSSDTNYYNSGYNENFPILIKSTGLAGVNYTGSHNTNSDETDGAGSSAFRGNYVIDSEVIDIGSAELLNPHSNTTAIYCNNQAVSTHNGKSNFPTDGGIYNCLVDPGEFRTIPSTASLFNGSYLDGFISSSLKQTSASLGDWLAGAGSSTGSNGDWAYSSGTSWNGGVSIWRKISGSWVPYNAYINKYDNAVSALSGYRAKNNIVKNCQSGFYLDSWRNNAFVEDNQFIEVEGGVKFNISDIGLTSSFKNVVIRDNYIKLCSHERFYTGGHSIGIASTYRPTGQNTKLRHVDNLQIENNLFELPISQSIGSYSAYPRRHLSDYPRYVGIYFSSETSTSGSFDYVRRSTIIRNNQFLNWGAPTGSSYYNGSGDSEPYGHNLPLYFELWTSSIEFNSGDPVTGPFPLSLAKFKNEFLPRYLIEGNTYTNPNYPATSSLIPISYWMTAGAGSSSLYSINQVSRFADLTVKTASMGTLTVNSMVSTGSLHGSSSYSTTSSYALTASYSLNGGSVVSGTGEQIWASSSVSLTLDDSGSLQDENGNPIYDESSGGAGSSIYYTGSVSIGSSASISGYNLYVSGSITASAIVVSNGFVNPNSGSSVPTLTGSMFYSGSNLFIFTGNGNAGGLVGWKTASLGG